MSDKRTMTEAEVRSLPSIALAVCAIGLCVFAAMAIVASRGKFSRMIDEFAIDVSVVTEFALGPLLPAMLVVISLATIAKEFVPAFRAGRDAGNFVVLLLGAIALAIYVVGIFSPLLTLIAGLSS
jgi:hypothetical protein